MNAFFVTALCWMIVLLVGILTAVWKIADQMGAGCPQAIWCG